MTTAADAQGLTGTALLAVRFALDLLFATILVRGIYYPAYRRADLFLTFYSFNLVIFLVTLLLNRVEMTMGAAFGLFAVFSMLRYRTEGISAKDMTYLFLLIALGLLMAVAPGGIVQIVFIGLAFVVSTFVLEGSWSRGHTRSHDVLYDNIRLIGAERRDDLLADLRARTGLRVVRVDVHEIDLLRDAARLTVHYSA